METLQGIPYILFFMFPLLSLLRLKMKIGPLMFEIFKVPGENWFFLKGLLWKWRDPGDTNYGEYITVL